MTIRGIVALLVGLTVIGSAQAQDDPLECELFGCEEPPPGDTTDDGTSGDETPGDETPGDDTSGEGGSGDEGSDTGDGETGDDDETSGDEPVRHLALPEAASDQGVASSAKGIATANHAGRRR